MSKPSQTAGADVRRARVSWKSVRALSKFPRLSRPARALWKAGPAAADFPHSAGGTWRSRDPTGTVVGRVENPARPRRPLLEILGDDGRSDPAGPSGAVRAGARPLRAVGVSPVRSQRAAAAPDLARAVAELR